MSHYPHLFAPIRVRNVYIKNRIESVSYTHLDVYKRQLL